MSNRRKLSRPKPTVVVAFIHPGETSAYFTTSLAAMLLSDQANDKRIVGMVNEWSSANVAASRNHLTSKFLDDYDADWLLWIDADMAWEHYALEQLLAVADKDAAPIVGGLCFGSHMGKLFPTIYQFVNIDGELSTVRVNSYEPESMVACDATGAAFLLIHRSVLVKFREAGFNRTFPFFQETEMRGEPVGEDITFCVRARHLGYPIWVHTGVKVGHHKSQVLTDEIFAAQSALPDPAPVLQPTAGSGTTN